MVEQKTVTVYRHSGGFYLKPEIRVRHETGASAFRRASELGFTHMEVFHGSYSTALEEFVVNPIIDGYIVRIPKRYRVVKVEEER